MAIHMKAIETEYNGYRFRSRLEAKWAVFFDTLGITYRYETDDGFNLNGTWYLPDFWLPEQNCWIEIKGKAPTAEELEKADLLQIHTGSPVHIFYEDVYIPGEKSGHAISTSFDLYGRCYDLTESDRRQHRREDLKIDDLSFKDMEDALGSEAARKNATYIDIHAQEIKPHILYVLYFLCKQDVWLLTDYGSIYIHVPCKTPINIYNAIHKMVNDHHDDLVSLLCPFEGFRFFLCMRRDNKNCWQEYRCCHKFAISSSESEHGWCDCNDYEGFAPVNRESSRLIKAYTSARQARFDGRKTA